MKKYTFNISAMYIDKFFSPVRHKTEVINILMESIRYMILNPQIEDVNSSGKIVLVVDKMSRLFFFKEDKFFSINFPFYVSNDSSFFSFKYKNICDIDSSIVSNVVSTLNCKEFDAHCSLDFFDPISNQESINNNFWTFFKDLLLMETGYIRYDHDITTYNKFKDQDREHEHPLHHFDVFYSNNTTFKIGLFESLDEEGFLDILNTKTNCKYFS